MTVQEAIKELQVGYLGDTEEIVQAKHMGIKALEKQIPKKPIKTPILWGSEKRCSSCNEAFRCNIAGYKIEEAIGNIKYCFHCGQKLDWEEGGTSD